MKMKRTRTLSIVAAAAFIQACAGSGGGDLYEAEKGLFAARKLNSDLTIATADHEFVERAVEAYRKVVRDYGHLSGDVEGMEEIIVSAQMELSELEFRTGMLEAARDDFLSAFDYARTIEPARANALWSAGYASMEMGDLATARQLFTRFVDTFLGPDDAERTFRMNARYLVTPLRIAEIEKRLGSERGAREWFDRASAVYGALIESSSDSLIVRETRYNLLTARLQGGDWQEASRLVARMKEIYRNPVDSPSLLFLEAKIESEGLGRDRRAIERLEELTEQYPSSHQELPAMLMLASLHAKEGDAAEAKRIYREVIEKHGDSTREAAEASWQLAAMAESEGDWVEASLLYKSTYTDYPATVQGMESPIRIAKHFSAIGEAGAAAAAFERARELYSRLMTDNYSRGVRIMAEEYYIRSLTEEKKWEQAAERLLSLPGKYPDYRRFMENHLMAASIYETELGDTARAVTVLEECARLYPDSEVAAEAARQIDRIRKGG